MACLYSIGAFEYLRATAFRALSSNHRIRPLSVPAFVCISSSLNQPLSFSVVVVVVVSIVELFVVEMFVVEVFVAVFVVDVLAAVFVDVLTAVFVVVFAVVTDAFVDAAAADCCAAVEDFQGDVSLVVVN